MEDKGMGGLTSQVLQHYKDTIIQRVAQRLQEETDESNKRDNSQTELTICKQLKYT